MPAVPSIPVPSHGKHVRLLRKYFQVHEVDTASIRPRLWNADIGPADYIEPSDKYRNAVLEQYKIYAELADRISERRARTNTFFLTINTAVFATIAAFWKNRPTASAWFLVFPLIVLLAQCLAWFWLVRSYRQLNTAKYVVIGLLEERLPASPYRRAEWTALGEGEDPSLYWPFSHIEQWIPGLFALCYIGGFVTALTA